MEGASKFNYVRSLLQLPVVVVESIAHVHVHQLTHEVNDYNSNE